MTGSFISGCGSYLPAKIMKNTDLEKIVETSDEWIVSRTGIKQRHIAEENEFTSHMAAKASEQALDNAGLESRSIDLIIVATTTPDQTFPSTAVKVQALLGISSCPAFDVQAVCSGFIYALSIADCFIKTNKANHVLVIGAEKMSSIVDWSDRNTCVLFGDGAGAIILSKTEENNNGIIDTKIYSDGNFQDILYTNGGVCSSNTSGKIKMIGKDVFRHAVEKMSNSVIEILLKNNLSGKLDFLIPHQANARILESVSGKLNLRSEKIISTLELHGNTSAASIPLALAEANRENKFKHNNLLALTAIGGGLTWGSCLLYWKK